MNNYETMKTNVEGYDRFVICLSSEGLMDHMNELEGSLSETETNGKVLIDQLLITGDGANRFMSCQFSDGKFDFKTAHTVDPTEYYRNKTVEFLHDNNYYVENSILTDAQRQKINSFEPEQVKASQNQMVTDMVNGLNEIENERLALLSNWTVEDVNYDDWINYNDRDSQKSLESRALCSAIGYDLEELDGKKRKLPIAQDLDPEHDENLTMNFGAGLNDLSDMEQNQGPEQC